MLGPNRNLLDETNAVSNRISRMLCRYLADVPNYIASNFAPEVGSILAGIWPTIGANMSDQVDAQAVLEAKECRKGNEWVSDIVGAVGFRQNSWQLLE